MIAAILAHLSADPTLLSFVSGGFYDAAEVGVIARETTPAAFDANRELLPCLLIRETDDRPAGPHPFSARIEITLYWYQRLPNATAIDQARRRAYVLLHRQRIVPVGQRAWECRHQIDTPSIPAPELSALLIISRYTTHVRKDV